MARCAASSRTSRRSRRATSRSGRAATCSPSASCCGSWSATGGCSAGLPDLEALRAVREPTAIQRPSEVDPRIARGIDDIVMMALQRDRDRRPTAAQLGQQLRSLRYSLETTVGDPAAELARVIENAEQVAREATPPQTPRATGFESFDPAEMTVIRIRTADGFSQKDNNRSIAQARQVIDRFEEEETRLAAALGRSDAPAALRRPPGRRDRRGLGDDAAATGRAQAIGRGADADARDARDSRQHRQRRAGDRDRRVRRRRDTPGRAAIAGGRRCPERRSPASLPQRRAAGPGTGTGSGPGTTATIAPANRSADHPAVIGGRRLIVAAAPLGGAQSRRTRPRRSRGRDGSTRVSAARATSVAFPLPPPAMPPPGNYPMWNQGDAVPSAYNPNMGSPSRMQPVGYAPATAPASAFKPWMLVVGAVIMALLAFAITRTLISN